MKRYRGAKLALQAGALGAVLMHASSCTLPDFLKPSSRVPTPSVQPTEQADSQGMILSAVPIYSLVVDPALAGVPSRLMVVQVRVGTIGDAALSVSPEDVALTLPNGEPARIFDRARAVEILHRTMLASTSHTSGAPDSAALAPADTLSSNLLEQGVFINGQTLVGYLVVDTGTPLTSLDGSTVRVTAYRLRDSEPVLVTYQFASVPPTAEAH